MSSTFLTRKCNIFRDSRIVGDPREIVCWPRPFLYGSGPGRRPLGNLSHGPSETAFSLELSMAGNVRTTTMRAYDREEMSGSSRGSADPPTAAYPPGRG
jgi:hypothetical protein